VTYQRRAAAEEGPASERQALNLKQVARRLGVHYMTAYRYVRQGRLEAVLEGTTWLVPEDALERLKDELGERYPRPATPAARPHDEVDWASRLGRCMLAGDEADAWRVARAALAAGRTLTFCYTEMLGNALATIGARWEAGEISVAEQHLATAVATRVVARLGALSRRPGRPRGTVVFGAPLGELHALPVAIAADLVRQAGFAVLELGANAPPEAFVLAAQRAPRLVAVGIGITSADWLGPAQDVIDALAVSGSDVPVIIGGQAAMTVEGAGLRGVSVWAPDGPAAVAAIDGIARRGRRRGAGGSGAADLLGRGCEKLESGGVGAPEA